MCDKRNREKSNRRGIFCIHSSVGTWKGRNALSFSISLLSSSLFTLFSLQFHLYRYSWFAVFHHHLVKCSFFLFKFYYVGFTSVKSAGCLKTKKKQFVAIANQPAKKSNHNWNFLFVCFYLSSLYVADDDDCIDSYVDRW